MNAGARHIAFHKGTYKDKEDMMEDTIGWIALEKILATDLHIDDKVTETTTRLVNSGGGQN